MTPPPTHRFQDWRLVLAVFAFAFLATFGFNGMVTLDGFSTFVNALLLVSELVSNAVLHARSSMIVSMTRSPDRTCLRVSVHDDQVDGAPSVRDADGSATSGRGLAIVQKVSTRWGIAPDHDGKSVWFELRAPR